MVGVWFSENILEKPRAAAVALLLLAALVYARALGFDFIAPVDRDLFLDNPHLAHGIGPDSWVWAWSTFEGGLYRPFAWISHAIDRSLFGTNAWGPHLVNLTLHGVATLLVWRVFVQATARSAFSFLVAALFALHPLQVQTVALVGERQGLLAAVFGLFAIERAVRGARSGSRGDVVAAHLLFVASVLSKPVLVGLAPVLMLLDHWPLQRDIRWIDSLREKVGYLVIGVGASVVAVLAQLRFDGLGSLADVGVATRVANAAVAYERTLRRVFWPSDLAAYHPYRFDVPAVEVALATLLLVGLLALAWNLRKRFPALATGLGWWLLLQLPTVNLVQFGSELTADRFSYVPLVGLFVVLVDGVGRWKIGSVARTALASTALLACAFTSVLVLAPWHDGLALHRHTLAVSGGSMPTHLALGDAHRAAGDLGAALSQYNEAQLFAPHSVTVKLRIADTLDRAGNYGVALARYVEALRMDPAHPRALLRVGEMMLARGDVEAAEESIGRALVLEPENPELNLGMAAVMREAGREEAALELLQRALGFAPRRAGIRTQMAWIHATSRDESLRAPQVALELVEADERLGEQDAPLTLEARAACLAALGRPAEAAVSSERAEERARELDDSSLARRIRERRRVYLPESGL